jgi:regulator of protease activity HflC (stomatin/prohibitin superfamily)
LDSLSYFPRFTVKQQSSVIVERFGKFHSVRQSRVTLKIPLIDRCWTCKSKNQQLDVIIETKTKDNVFVKLNIRSIYGSKDTVYDAFYKLEYTIKSPHMYLTLYVLKCLN